MSSSIAAITATRRPKWQHSQSQPTPRILHLPRRPRRRPSSKTHSTKPTSSLERKGKLETLFDQERVFSTSGNYPIVVFDYGGESERRRERVEEEEIVNGGGVMVEEEKWKFQAEILRAECNLLRMEREIAVKKMERTNVQMERILKSAVHTLISGRKKICEGKNVKIVLEEEILDLADKLEKLQRRSPVKDFKHHQNSNNFDTRTSFLRKRLEMFSETSNEMCIKEIQEMAEASLSIKSRSSKVDEISMPSNQFIVEILRRKMEGLSKGTLLERMKEDCGSMLSTASSSVTSSASTSKRIEFPKSSSSKQKPSQANTMPDGVNICSGRCKAIIRRIMDQVRDETEQWSQMQEMLSQVREEMEELQTSRDFWEGRALSSDHQIHSLQSAVQEWRQRAITSESKAKELQIQISMLHKEVESLREGTKSEPPTTSKDAQSETEKRVLICRLKENHQIHDNRSRRKEEFSSDDRKKMQTFTVGQLASRRLPFRDIENSSLSARENRKTSFRMHCPEFQHR